MTTENKYAVLVQGNILSKSWARKIMGRRKLGKFLSVLFRPSRAEALNVPQEQVDQILAIPSEDRMAILATQNVVHDICLQFERLAERIARKFARGVGKDNDADVSQLESEAKVGLLKAIRGYTNLSVKFITYAYTSMSNEVSRYLQRQSGSLTGANMTLLVRYKRCVEKLVKAGLTHSFEDVCRELELNERQSKRLLLSVRSEVATESDMEQSLASILLDRRQEEGVDAEFIHQLESVSLSLLEKCAWISQNEDVRQLFPDAFTNLVAVATHFEVTPQAASEAVKRARKKLAAALGKEWNPSV